MKKENQDKKKRQHPASPLLVTIKELLEAKKEKEGKDKKS